MRKKKTARFPRVMSGLLALLMTVGMLPIQAAAASADDDPATWPEPDSRYTAPGEDPMYIYLDFRGEDGGVFASHYCDTEASLDSEVVKATASSDGYVKYVCDTCGSWARINVPALTLKAFTIDPAYQGVVDNGVEYSGDAYTIVYNVSPEYQRFLGTKLNNKVSVTSPGVYNIIATVKSIIYDNVQLQTAETLRVYPKAVPWTTKFASKIYDGTSLLDGKTVTYTDVYGASIPAVLTIYQVKVENGTLKVDENTPVSNPVAAGPYGIGATITDSNYVWQSEGEKYNTIYSLAWIHLNMQIQQFARMCFCASLNTQNTGEPTTKSIDKPHNSRPKARGLSQ